MDRADYGCLEKVIKQQFTIELTRANTDDPIEAYEIAEAIHDRWSSHYSGPCRIVVEAVPEPEPKPRAPRRKKAAT